MIHKNFNNVFLNKYVLSLSILFLGFSCQSKATIQNISIDENLQKTQLQEKSDVIIPKGNELQINITKSESNEIAVRFTNVSDQNIFCSYLPQENSKKVAYFPYIIEKRKGTSDFFETYRESGHFAPGLNPIMVGETIESSNMLFDKGDYRIKVSYLVDKSISKLINEKVPEPGLTDSERERVAYAYKEAISPIITVSESTQSNE